jgi:dipeptidyl aminopeptidase/acylaminoacyl peptidase
VRTFVLGALVLAFLAWSAPPVGAQAAPGQLAFAGPFGIWTIRDDGRGEQLLPTGSPADMPAWSPDGQRLVYVITAGPETGVWISDLRDGSRRQLAREPWRWPAWSPDGRRIAFTLPRWNGSDLGIWDLQLGAAVMLTIDGFNEAPQWWPDGSRLLFSRNNEVWIIRADGAEAGPMRGLVGVPVLQAAWSPDGLRLAYLTTPRDRSFFDPTSPVQLWVATSEGFDGQWIAEGAIDRTQRISWSPDGNRIAFAVLTGLGSDIFTIYRTGGDWQRLSDGRNPAWRPLAVEPTRPVSAVCALEPQGMYADAFRKRPDLRLYIGCPTGEVSTVQGVMQQYEGGFLYYRNVPAGTSVWVFLANGTWLAGDPRPQAPVPLLPPPPGRVQPRNAFLAVWLALGGPASPLGWAVTEETGFPSDSQPYERGLAFAGNNRVVFVNIDGTYVDVPLP